MYLLSFLFSWFFKDNPLSSSFTSYYFSLFLINFRLLYGKNCQLGRAIFLELSRAEFGFGTENMFDVIYSYIFQVGLKCIFSSTMNRCKLCKKDVVSRKHLLLQCLFSFVFGHWPTSLGVNWIMVGLVRDEMGLEKHQWE